MRGGNIASEAAARSAPDGYTLYLAGEFLASNGFLYPKLSYDPIADFTPVSLVVQYPTVIVVPNSSPARTLAEFIAHARASPTTLTSATAGHGTGSHLVAELFKRCHLGADGNQLAEDPYLGGSAFDRESARAGRAELGTRANRDGVGGQESAADL